MIVGELPLDGGDVILTKGKTLGYLAQHQNLDTQNTIYEELKTAKSDIISLEEQIRSIELELKSLTGDELNTRLNTYNRLMSEFENKNGYAYESETQVYSKVLGLRKKTFLNPPTSFPVVRRPVCHWVNFCSPNRIFCCWTSRPTTWT